MKTPALLSAVVTAFLLPLSALATTQVAGGNATNPVLSVDATSNAAHVTIYRDDGGIATPGTGATYAAASTSFTPGTTPQDVFTITGSASKVIRVLQLGFSSTQSAAGTNDWFLLKRSTANSGGTSASATAVPMDRNDASATATVLQYTVNPTAGSLVGNIWHAALYTPLATPTGPGYPLVGGTLIDFTRLFGRTVVLRGTGDVLSLNFAGAALPAGLSMRCYVVWTEDST